MIKRIAGLILLLLSIPLLLGFVHSLNFTKTGLAGIVGIGNFNAGNGRLMGARIFKQRLSGMCNLRNYSNPPQFPVFFAIGLNAYTNHLRLFTCSKYVNGVWIEDRVRYGDRQGFTVSRWVTRYEIIPVITFKGHIPVAKDTCYVSVKAGYNASTGTYMVKSCSTPYIAISTAHRINVSEAAKKGFSKIYMERWEYERIRALALKVTEGAKNDYEKVMRIEDFLKRNYRYDPLAPPPPKGVDPVYWFLFKEKRGICKEFASAFVVMCNSIGIPARLVVGYLARPVPYNQTVFASQAHVWAEVRFKEGWVEFDPTPNVYRVETVTKITRCKRVVREGETFLVEGYVRTRNGYPVSGYVEIYLMKEKWSGKGRLLKVLRFKDGRFRAEVKAPKVVGRFYILAHYVGSLRFKPSWSDPVITIIGNTSFKVDIPDKVSTNLTVTGYLLDCNGTGIEGRITVKVDGKIRDVVRSDRNGRFVVFLRLSKGYHRIELVYRGSKSTAPAYYSKVVEAGDLDVITSTNRLIAGRVNRIYFTMLFNGKPLRNCIITVDTPEGVFRVETDSRGIGTLKVKPKRVGDYPIEFNALGFGRLVIFRSLSPVYLSWKGRDGGVVITIRDVTGRGVNGRVFVNGKEYRLRNGTVFVRGGGTYRVYYPGDRYHLPLKETIRITPNYTYLLPLLAVLPISLYLYIRRGGVQAYLEKEHKGLPPIWRVGESVRVVVRCKEPYRILVDGRPVEGNVIRFERPGRHVIRVERVKDGKGKELSVLIVEDYGKAVEYVFKSLEDYLKGKGMRVESLTAREIFRRVKCKAENLLRTLELYRYGGRRGFTREDFVKAYVEFEEVKRCV